MTPETAPEFLSVSQLCRRLDLSEKTVRNRIKSGEIPARKVAAKRGGFAFQIPLEWVEKQPEATGNRPENHVEANGISIRNQPEDHAESTGSDRSRLENDNTTTKTDKKEEWAANVCEQADLNVKPGGQLSEVDHVEATGSTRNFHTEPTGKRPEATGADWKATVETRELEILREQARNNREEIQFLRGLIEQRDRDAAELRAALREALRAMPKQLNSAPENETKNEKKPQVEAVIKQNQEVAEPLEIQASEVPKRRAGIFQFFRRRRVDQ